MSNFEEKLAAWDSKAPLMKKEAISPGAAAVGASMLAGSGSGGVIGGIKGLGLLGVAVPAAGVADTASYRVNRFVNSGLRGLAARVKADEVFANKMVGSLANLTSDIGEDLREKAIKGYKKRVNAPKHRAVLKELLTNDEVISQADSSQVANLFDSMTKIAPNMSKHKEAVRSFMRQGLAHEGGVDPLTFGQLARAEAALTGASFKGLD